MSFFSFLLTQNKDALYLLTATNLVVRATTSTHTASHPAKISIGHWNHNTNTILRCEKI